MAVNARVHNVARGNRRSYSEQLFTEWLSRCLQNARLSRARGAEWADRVSRQRDRARVREHARVLTAAVDSGLCSADWLCLRSSAHGSVHWKRALGSAAAAAAEHAAVPQFSCRRNFNRRGRGRKRVQRLTHATHTHTSCWCVRSLLLLVRVLCAGVRACVCESAIIHLHTLYTSSSSSTNNI